MIVGMSAVAPLLMVKLLKFTTELPLTVCVLEPLKVTLMTFPIEAEGVPSKVPLFVRLPPIKKMCVWAVVFPSFGWIVPVPPTTPGTGRLCPTVTAGHWK